MGDKKKAPDPIPKVPDPPAKQATPPAGAPTTQAGAPEKAQAPAAPVRPLDLTLTPPSLLTPPNGASPGFTLPPANKDPIDWFGMRQPFLTHGLPMTAQDGDQLASNFHYSLRLLQNWGMPPDLAIKVTNLGLSFAYDTQLGRESPNTLEKFDADTEKMLGPGKTLGKLVVPVITPDTLGWAVEKVTGKKIDFRF
jgi:hypothetical protein